MAGRAAVITCSDLAAADPKEDRGGPVLREALRELGFEVLPAVIVPLDVDAIRQAIAAALADGCRVIATAGGTSLGPRDVTVDATKPFLAYELPGVMDEVRRRGAPVEPRSVLSRGLIGVVAPDDGPRALLVNAPGSRGGARDTIAVVGPLLAHIMEQFDDVPHRLD